MTRAKPALTPLPDILPRERRRAHPDLYPERHPDMKITDLKVWVTQPEPRGRSFVFLRIDTDEGISGVGEATGSGVRQS